jgi:hypothetical protein
MPNHVTNELTAPKHVIDALKSGESDLDLNTVVPMPEIMKGNPHMGITQWAEIAMGIVNLKTLQQSTPDPVAAFKSGDYGAASQRIRQSNIIRAMTEGPFPIDWNEKDFEMLIQSMRALKEYGHASWYEWANANWGTKWNAYQVTRVGDTVIKFQTAWSMPAKWFQALVEKYPEEEISIRWADEDFGNNVVVITVKGENVTGGVVKSGSAEAHKVAMELIHGGVVPEYMKAEPDGRYSYTE